MRKKSVSCTEVKEELLAVSAGEADAATDHRVQAHLDTCEDCRREMAALRHIDREVTAMRRRPLLETHELQARRKLEERLADLKTRLVAYDVVPSPIGPILIARSEQGVMLVEYLGRQSNAEALRVLKQHGLEPSGGKDVAQLSAELNEYLGGQRTRLDWPLDLRLAKSPFHREVLQFTASIPRGAVVSYGGLAADIGRPRAVRAAAQALRWNPLPIVIPCHRVIGTSGALTGYAGGTSARKQKLLEVEGISTVKVGHDFRILRETMYVLAPHEREYCLPSCPSSDPFPRGGLLFASRAQAEATGLAPCTTCRPDLHPLHGAQA
jgi:methylated-DNA-[protein]-cysteine S-methyltransferase